MSDEKINYEPGYLDKMLAQIIRVKKEMIIKDGESTDESEIYCPHCGHEQVDAKEYLGCVDEWKSSECESCDREFSVTWEPVYSTKKAIDG